MGQYNLKDYKKLDRKFYKILMNKNSNWRTYCISLLQFIKPHTEYFVKYDLFFSNNFFYVLFCFFNQVINLFLKLIKWFIRMIEELILSLFLKKIKNIKNFKSDIVFITCLVNSNTVSSRKNINKDFIFGSIIHDLRKSFNVKVIYINLTRKNSRLTFNEIKSNKDIIVLKKILSIKNEFLLFLEQIKELKNIIINIPQKNISLYEMLLISINIFSYESRHNFRVKVQLSEILKKMKPKISVVSFEGHCWEKLVFEICKREILDSKCRNVGYQHAGVIKNQLHFKRKYRKNFNPDFLLTSGQQNQKHFYKIFSDKKNKLYDIGSNRHISVLNTLLIKKIKDIKNNNCLIVPEGTFYETKILFDFSYAMAKRYKNWKFTLRTHPQVNMNKFLKKFFIFNRYEKLNNLIFSQKTFIDDLKDSKFLFYRGSTGAISGIMNGVTPIYVNLPKEKLNLDPMFELKKFKLNIKKIDEFEKIAKVQKKNIKEFKFALNFCKKYFTLQTKNKTMSIFNQIINRN